MIDQVLQVKRIANLGGPSTGTADPNYKRPVRPQPKGLKARFQPIGVSRPLGTIGDESTGDDADTEMVDAAGPPGVPVASASSKETAKGKKKRTTKTVEEEIVGETPKKSKKSKDKHEDDSNRKGKRKLTTSEEDAAAASSQLLGENQVAGSNPKKQKTARKASPDLGAKVTPVTVPTPGFSFNDLPANADTSTPKPAKKSSKKTAAKESKSKVETSQPAAAPANRNTPIAPPVIYGMPSSSAVPSSSAPTPSGKPKKSAGGKKKDTP